MGLDRDYRKFSDPDHAALWGRAAEFMVRLGYERPKGGGSKPWRFSESEKKFDAGGQSLVVDPRKRKWYAHKGGQGGTSLISLLKYELGVSWPEACRLAHEFLGSHGQETASSKRPDDGPASAPGDRSAEAAAIWRDSLRVAGSPAELYLRNERQIPNDHWPTKLVRYCSNAFPGSRKAQPAVVFPLTDAAGKVRAVQRIVLNSDGTPALDAEGKRIKRSLGPMSGAAWRLPGTDDALILAEGTETAATVWAVTGKETWALCGSMGKADLSGIPLTRPIIISQDADPPNSPSAQSLNKAIRRWRREGRTVLTVRPPGNDKSDWNDVIRTHGTDAVSKAFSDCWKANPLPLRLPLLEAEIALQDALETSMAKLLKERG